MNNAATWAALEWSGIGIVITAVATAVLGWVKGKQDGRKLAVDSLAMALDRANSEIDRMLARITILEQGQQDLPRILAHIESMHSWIERGQRPPAPLRPPWLPPGVFSPLTNSSQEDRNA